MNKFLCFLALLFATGLSAQSLRTVPIRRVGVIADNVGATNFAVADLDGDGINEIISCSEGAPFAVTRSGSSFTTMWRGPAVGCTGVAAGDQDSDGGTDIIVTTTNPNGTGGSLMVFDPRSLGGPRATVTLPGNLPGADVAIGNIDSDSHNEIVVVTSANTYVYDGPTLSLKWTGQGYGGKKVRLGDVYGQGYPDIVVNGSSGWILDGLTHSMKLGYVGGFGRAMAVGDVDGDGKAEVAFAAAPSATSVTILNIDTQQSSTIPGTTSPAVDSLTIGDANADGSTEIITGNNQWGAIEGRRPSDGLLLWSINNPEHGVQGMAYGDVTGDGKGEVIWGAGESSSGQDILFVGNAVSKSILWQCVDLDGSFASAVGDLDGDGRLEYVVASASSQSGYNGSVIEIFDMQTGVSKGTLSLGSQPDFSVSRLLIAQTDNDAAKEIVAIGTNIYDPMILVWDGVTHNREYTSAVNNPSFVTRAILAADVDADGVDEIIVGESDSKVLVLAGASNFIQASIVVNGSVQSLAIADVDGDGVLDLVVGTSTTLYVYNTTTWAIEGQLSLSSVTSVAAASGSVSAITGDGAIHLYAGTSLSSVWTCTAASLGTSGSSALAFSSIAGVSRLLAGDGSGNIRLLPLTGAACPSFTTNAVSNNWIVGLKVVDATGDGRGDLLLDTGYSSEVDLLGLSTETRGDVNGDGLINSTDIDTLTDYLFGTAVGISPSADANADQRVGVEDLFQMIAYKYSGGATPPP
jgi:hypothetical protein